MKIACHAVLFGEKISTETQNVLEQIKSTGCSGFEFGSRFMAEGRGEAILKTADELGLTASGLHVSLLLTNLLDDYEGAVKTLTDAATFLAGTSCRNLIMTGLVSLKPFDPGTHDPRMQDPAQVAGIARRLNEVVRTLKQDYQVQVHYHNHYWEFANGGLLYFSLIEHAPDLLFAMDTGWVAISGYDPAALIARYPSRFRYIHLRDYDAAKNWRELEDPRLIFSELGEGAMDYPRLMRTLKSVLGPDAWVVVEYEVGEQDIRRHIRAVARVQALLSAV